MAAKSITVIPATKMMHTGLPRNAAVKRRVAGYARVSTDSEEQQTSYEAQVDYYTKYIQSKPEWTFVVSSQVKCTLFRQQMHTFSRPIFNL